jgi:hypothetical protein
LQGGENAVSCRFDWHQTASKVVVAVYAKNYDPSFSSVEVHPARLKIHAYFPEEGGAFDMDLELKGVRTLYQMRQDRLWSRNYKSLSPPPPFPSSSDCYRVFSFCNPVSPEPTYFLPKSIQVSPKPTYFNQIHSSPSKGNIF